MLKCRLKAPNGNQLVFFGLTPADLEELAVAPIAIEGESVGLPEDTMVVIIAGADAQHITREIEHNLPVKFPRDEKTGRYITVND